MKKISILHVLVSFLLTAVAAVLLLIPEPGGTYVRLFGLELLPVVLCGTLCGDFFGLLSGLVVPSASLLLLPETVFMPDTFGQMILLAASGFFAGWVFRKLRYSIPAAMIGILAGRIAYGLFMLLFCFFSGTVYTSEAFLSEAVIEVWPGLLVCLSVTPILMRLLHMLGLTTLLGNEPAGKEKEIVHRVS